MAVYHLEVRVGGMVGGGTYNPKGNVKMKENMQISALYTFIANSYPGLLCALFGLILRGLTMLLSFPSYSQGN